MITVSGTGSPAARARCSWIGLLAAFWANGSLTHRQWSCASAMPLTAADHSLLTNDRAESSDTAAGARTAAGRRSHRARTSAKSIGSAGASLLRVPSRPISTLIRVPSLSVAKSGRWAR